MKVTTESLHSDAIADVSRIGNTITVEPKPTLSGSEGCALLFCWFLTAFITLISAAGIIFSWGTFGVLLVTPIFLLSAWGVVALPVYATRYVDPPRFIFDLDKQIISCCIPPFTTKHHPLDEISAIEVVRVRGSLCLRIDIKGRLRRISVLSVIPEARADSKILLEPVEVTLSRIRPIAELLANRLSKPLRVWTESSSWYSSKF